MARNININAREFAHDKVTHELLTTRKTNNTDRIKNENFFLLII